jgi:hypothetical protein
MTDPSKGNSKKLLTSNDALQERNKTPDGPKRIIFSIHSTKRVGLASFIRGKKDHPERPEIQRKAKTGANPDDLVGVFKKESWGPINKDDPAIAITIV